MKDVSKHTLSRREALAAMGAMGLFASTGLSISKAVAAVEPKIAIQLYTMRKPAGADLSGTLKKLREMGWKYVQWSGMPNLPAEKIREELDTAGLKAIACHCGVEQFETDYENYVNFWKTVGCPNVGPGGMMGDCQKTAKDWIRGTKRMDAVGAKLAKEGMRLHYHNHAHEFEKFEDDPRCKHDILMEESSQGNLYAELDVAWVQVGGVDPAKQMLKNKGRCTQIHAKDVTIDKKGKHAFTPLGQGELNWDEIIAAAKKIGLEWYIYEQDSGVGDPFDYANASYEFISKQAL